MTGRPDPVAYLGEVARSLQGRDYKKPIEWRTTRPRPEEKA